MASATLPQVKPEQLSLDRERLEAAYNLLTRWTEGPSPAIPGAAIVVGRHGQIVPTRFFGKQGPEAGAGPIRPDGMFLLASISKPITYLGAMKLVERGLLGLTDKVTHYIPEFAAHHKEEIQVHHLFTHTSGLPDMLPSNQDLRQQHAPLGRFIEGAIRDTVPLFPPGTSVSYQSMGTLIVAELIQRLSGMSIATYLKEEVFDPLRLESIGLGARGFRRERLVRVETPSYQAGGDFGWNSPYWQDLGSPWGGVFSAPGDLAVLCQLMLNRGQWNEVRILAPDTVDLMTQNRLHDYPALPESFRRTTPWGLGWQMNHVGHKDSWGDLLGAHVFGHTGATGTMCWMDRERDGFCLLLTTAIRSKAPWRLQRLSNMIASSFLS